MLQELKKLHQQFYHLSTDKLLNVFKGAFLSQCSINSWAMLEEIQKGSQICSTLKPRPISFQLPIPKDYLVFNHEIALDLIWLKGRAALHFVELATSYVKADILEGDYVEDK